MKILKKISLVYTLQIFAVIFLLGYAVATPLINTKDPVTNGIRQTMFDAQPLSTTKGDSILAGKTNDLWHVHATKDR